MSSGSLEVGLAMMGFSRSVVCACILVLNMDFFIEKVPEAQFELEIAQQFLADLKQGYENRD